MLDQISHDRIAGSRDENWNWILFALLGMFACIWLLGCASKKPVSVAQRPEASEERIRELETQLAEKAEAIERLQAQLEQKEAARSLRSKRASAERKVIRSAPDTSRIPASLIPSDDDEATLADSSQENMHYYYEGLSLLREKNFEKALHSLHRFLSLDPQHVYADRAQYLISRTHFNNREYGLAVVASNLLEARYPYSFKIPESLYERGLAYLQMNQEGQARTTLKALIQNFPHSASATDAARKLAELMSPSVDSAG